MNSILIHPTYFPSIVQMSAMAQANEVVFEVADNYQKQTYRNRTKIAHSNGLLTLTAPIKHMGKGEKQQYKDIRIENDFPWQAQHWKSLQSAYRTSPFFEYYEDDLIHLFEKPPTFLMEHNFAVIETISSILQLDVSTSKSQEYVVTPTQTDLRILARARQEKVYAMIPYTQVLQPEGEFLTNLSILDLLFNEGTNALSYLETQIIDL